MENTIIALLNNNLRVIIPDFGAFIIRQRQPRIIVFNEFLRYNDGILIDFIVKTEGIDREIAEQRVADFAEDGSKLLASGREMIIEGLGSLRKDSSGKINFIEAPEIIEIESKDTLAQEKIPEVEEKQEIRGTLEPEPPEKKEIPQIVEQEIPEKPESKTTARAKGKTVKTPAKARAARIPKSLPKTPSPDIPPRVAEPAPVEPQAQDLSSQVEPEAVIEAPPVEPKVEIEPTAVEPETVMEAPVETGSEFKSSTSLTQEAVDAAVAELQKTTEPADSQARQTIKPEVVPPSAYGSLPTSVTAGTVENHSPVSTNRILAWVIIILFVNAGILAWFVFRNKTHGTPAGKSATTLISDTLYDQLADSVRAAALDSSIVYDEVPVEKGNIQENTRTPGSRYYIVAGCFRDEINADSLVSSLKLRGYKAEKFGKIGNLYAVCFASFDNKDLAVSGLKKIRETVPSAWMTKF